MKKIFQVGAILCGILMTQFGYAQYTAFDQGQGSDGCCQPDHPTGECYCLYCKYEPQYYNDWRCCEEPKYFQRQCCRQVCKPYQVTRCRYVPQTYCETCYRYEPEYYCVTDCKMCKRWVCDKKCRYVPRYYWKHTCGNQGGAVEQAPVSGGCCGPQGCGAPQ